MKLYDAKIKPFCPREPESRLLLPCRNKVLLLIFFPPVLLVMSWSDSVYDLIAQTHLGKSHLHHIALTGSGSSGSGAFEHVGRAQQVKFSYIFELLSDAFFLTSLKSSPLSFPFLRVEIASLLSSCSLLAHAAAAAEWETCC